ncbi:hypothetical protein [Paracoccus cavernae]|uniref:hypothetical protein n=1 Tax=Paracoccus cavernae TaxID=1571207 RepID=UPI0035F41F69
MMNKAFAIVGTVVKAGAVSALLAGAAFAQTATTTTVPADQIPLAAQGLSDVQVKDLLTTKGMQDISVSRADGKITATGTRNGESLELIYNEADGTLITLNGKSGAEGANVDFRDLGSPKGN